MTHKEELFVLACTIAKATKKKDSDTALMAAFQLAATVTKEDLQEASAIVKTHIGQCDCAICTAAKAMRDKQETGESFAV